VPRGRSVAGKATIAAQATMATWPRAMPPVSGEKAAAKQSTASVGTTRKRPTPAMRPPSASVVKLAPSTTAQTSDAPRNERFPITDQSGKP